MRLEILGCSGGVGGERRSMALALEQHVLIDAGSGVGDLSLERMAAIEHVFLTHSHLDHTASCLSCATPRWTCAMGRSRCMRYRKP